MIHSFIKILITVFISLLLLISIACNNPFNTRDPQRPSSGGVSIKPQITPENVLGNLKASIEGFSIQDYLNIYSEDFVFHPDPDDSVLFEEEFTGGWSYEKEDIFANNFLQRLNFRGGISKPIQLDQFFEYRPGQNMYYYHYLLIISYADSTNENYEGEAWIYMKQNSEGLWSISEWVDKRRTKIFQTLGSLKAKNI